MKMILRIHAGSFKDHMKSQHFATYAARSTSQVKFIQFLTEPILTHALSLRQQEMK